MHEIKKVIFFILSVGYATDCLAQPATSPVRERLSMDKGWLFHLGDVPFLNPLTHDQTYNDSKAGNASGAAAVNYNDHDWQPVTLPHDWAIGLGFDSTLNVSEGYRKRGIGWYRRTFLLSPADKGKHLELQFDGIATYSTIWVNGTLVHRNWCGYTSSYIDITPLARYGDKPNVVAIRVDASAHEGWWYEGAGLYRHTWLVKRSPVHIITDGVYANPVKQAENSWLVPAEVTLESGDHPDTYARVDVSLYDPAGKKVGSADTTILIQTLHQAIANLRLKVPSPQLWSLEHPLRYTVKTALTQDGRIVDEIATRCGFRTILFTADSGFFLNGKHVELKGVCNHQDHAGVGVAIPDALWAFRLRKLKDMGANAYRCAHNPPAAEFLDACDSLGMLVMDENRNFNTSPEYIRQLQWMVRRDRNHPSIILWSVFNEEPMQGTENGYQMVRYMSTSVKDLDTTRPVTAAQSGGQFEPVNVSQAVDVVGFNYQQYDYDRFHKQNPNAKMTSSEDVSGLMERGTYITDKAKNLVDAYDLQAPEWGSTHRVAWKNIAERPFLAGCFIWTGFDYHGEPTPYTWPSAGSFFGIMDICGFPKTAFWLHQAQWRDDIDVLQLVPHWNWPADSIGKKIRVMALSNADSVKLVLNGKSISGQKADKYEMNTWWVPYAPGKLEAIGYKHGKPVSRFITETSGPPVALQLIADRAALSNDGMDATPVTVQAIDSKGRIVPTANEMVQFQLQGGGTIIGLGNGDPNSHDPEKGDRRSLFNGLAQVIIQTVEGNTETITLTASSPGLRPAAIQISLRPIAAMPSVPAPAHAQENTAIIPTPKLEDDSYNWYDRHSEVLRIKDSINPEIVMIGNSITHFWGGLPKLVDVEGRPRQPNGPHSWSSLFHGHRVLNLGFGWDRTQNVLWRLDHGELDALHPRLIIIEIGTNNTSETAHARMNTAAEIAAGIHAICDRVRTKIPAAKIVLMAILPREQSPQHPRRILIDQTNLLLANLARKSNLTFIDIGPQFLAADGTMLPGVTSDFTHPTEQGYAIWANAIRTTVEAP